MYYIYKIFRRCTSLKNAFTTIHRRLQKNTILAIHHLNSNKKPTEMSQKLIHHPNWNITKTEMSPKLICHQNWNVTKSEMSPKLKFDQNWIVTKTEVSSKLKCYQNWNVTKHYNVLKNQNLNSRDWHGIPWSCFRFVLALQKGGEVRAS